VGPRSAGAHLPEHHYDPCVGIGMAIFLIAAGAILRYAVTVEISGVELQTVGLILIIVGVIGLVISLAVVFGAGRGRSDEYPTRRYD
jgi:hypothetical protein